MNRGVVLKLYGDRRIAGAIADGMTKALSKEQVEIVKAEIDRQRILSSLVRVAVGNTTTPDEYEAMITSERYKRQRYERPESLCKTVCDFLLVAWALLWLVIHSCYSYLSAWNREP